MRNRKTVLKLWFLIFFAAAVSAVNLHAQEISIQASVDRNPVGVNDIFTYQVEVSGNASGIPEPPLPEFKDFTIRGGPNLSTSFQIINGSVQSSKTYSVRLLPRRTGQFVIPPVTLEYKGKTYRSNVVRVTVVSKSSGQNNARQRRSGRTQRPQASQKELFLKAVPSKKTVYVNEPVDVTIKLYFRIPVRNPNFVKQPEAAGFWVEEYQIPQNIPISTEVINGVKYNVAVVKRLALFPSRAGTLEISPAQLSVNVVQRRRRDPFNLFDDFFEDPFGRTVEKVLSTEPIKIEAIPFPKEGRPDNFVGISGNIRLRTRLDKTTVPANEAITYKVELTGKGNLKSLQSLPVQFPGSFEVYDPKVKNKVNPRAGNFTASKEWEYVLIPRSQGTFTIPPLEISYFDPQAKVYRTLTSRAYTVTVTEGKEIAGGPAGGYVGKSDVQLLGRDINYIKEKLSLQPLGYKPYNTGWFWAALLLPLLALGGAYGYLRHREKMSTNLEYARSRKAFKQAEHRLKGAQDYLKQARFAEFYGEVSKALLGFVADKTNRSAAGLLREEVEALLKKHQVDPELLTNYLKCLDEADFRRFAPGTVSKESAEEFYQRAREILAQLGKHFN